MSLPNHVRSVLVLAAACSVAAAQSIMSQQHEVVLAVGDTVANAPGITISGASGIDAPVIDQNGTLLFRARLLGAVSATDERAYFLGRGKGDVRMIVRAGDQAPGLPAGILLRTATSTGINGSPRISPFGEIVLFQSALHDPVNPANTPTTADSAFFWGQPGGLTVLAREGDPVPFPSLPGTTWGAMAASLQSTGINVAGQALFSTTLVGGPVTTANDGVVVMGTPGSLTIVSQEGDVWSGGEVVIPISGATQLSFITQINSQGYVLRDVRFSTTIGTATLANDRALSTWVAGNELIVVREGNPAPGLVPGVVFGNTANTWTPDTGNCTLTNGGKTAFLGSLLGGDTVIGTNDRALYHGDFNGLSLVMRRNDPCPGLANGETFGNTGNSSLTCNETDVAFINFLLGPSVTTANDSSIWVGNAGNLQMVAREGNLVPTSVLPAGVNGPWAFGAISTGTNNPLLNQRGDVIFQAEVVDPTAPATFKRVWLTWNKLFGLRLLLDAGDTFTTGLGTNTWSVVSSQAGFNSGDGSQPHFNNAGDFAVRPNLDGALVGAVIRTHVGSLFAQPASIDTATGGSQSFTFDCGAARAFNIYALLGTSSGSRPGFPSPFGPQIVPLNIDPWLQLSLDLANTSVYTNTLSLLDANGRGTASFNFPALPVFAGTDLHHAVVALDFSLNSTFVTEPVAVRLF